ncbi:hypothetical protein RAL98_03345 [Staphylococcus sp. HKU1]
MNASFDKRLIDSSLTLAILDEVANAVFASCSFAIWLSKAN